MDNLDDYISFLYNFYLNLPTEEELTPIKYDIQNENGNVKNMIDDVFKIIYISNDIKDTITNFIDNYNQNINDYQYNELNNYINIFNNVIRNMYNIIPPIIPHNVYEPYIIIS